ncbi:MAG: winged helix-turn-helix transcriptional regulator [Candidatus Micrarchaeota archaeon]|nr:winged helix-turn-helix transcriptional regulator [Candidatus Micrarchaeota archaeon]
MKKSPLPLLRALADPTRWRMLALLGRGERCACELPARVRVSQPAVSQHLAVLREAGLAVLRADGKKRLYSLSRKGRRIVESVGRWD